MERRQGTSPMTLQEIDPHTQLMRTNLGRPELGSFTLQKAYITFPLLSSSTSSSRPPSAESQEGSEAAYTLPASAHPTCLRITPEDEYAAQRQTACLAYIRSWVQPPVPQNNKQISTQTNNQVCGPQPLSTDLEELVNPRMCISERHVRCPPPFYPQ